MLSSTPLSILSIFLRWEKKIKHHMHARYYFNHEIHRSTWNYIIISFVILLHLLFIFHLHISRQSIFRALAFCFHDFLSFVSSTYTKACSTLYDLMHHIRLKSNKIYWNYAHKLKHRKKAHFIWSKRILRHLFGDDMMLTTEYMYQTD